MLGDKGLEGLNRFRIVFFGIGRMRPQIADVVERDVRRDFVCIEGSLIFFQRDIEIRRGPNAPFVGPAGIRHSMTRGFAARRVAAVRRLATRSIV